jgi:ABC-type branched-subunit amino acid transport system ATPase component/ABC-type branched-subunit amino acid transport system permease subunit
MTDAYHTLATRLRAAPAASATATRPLAAIGIAMIVFAGLIPLFAGSGDVILAQRSLYLGLLALSINFLVANVGLISFGHAMFWALGAYFVGIPFAKEVDFLQNPLIALAFTPILGAIAGFVIGLVVFRGRELYFSLLTLGVGQLIWAIAHGWQSLTGGSNGTNGVFAADWLNAFQHPHQLYWFIFAIVLVCTGALYVITKSPFGDALRGIRENRQRAEFAGLWVKRYEITAFVVASTFASIAGGLSVIGETQVNSDQIDWELSTRALIVALIGGTRYFLGPFAGAFFYLFIFAEVIDRTVLWDTVLGVIVLIVALTLTGGISGLMHWALAQISTVQRRLAGRPYASVSAHIAPSEEVHLAEATALPDAPPIDVSTRRPVLEVKGISKSFGGLHAVSNASITVREGTFHAIIGPNGAGKTTFFNLVTGLIKPDSGQVVLEGADITGAPAWRLVKRGMGRSFQQTSLFWTLSAIDNVTIAEAAVKDETLRFYGTHSQTIRDRCASLLDRVGLGRFAQTPAIELSHGDQRSLEIATALAVESKLLLLDEPTAGVSPAETKTAVEQIRRIATEQGLTVLFVEHDMEVVFGIADWITVLHQGSVLADGSPAEIRANPDVQKAYLGEVDEEEGPA